MLAPEAYQYALWRRVGDLERGAAMNAGVILYLPPAPLPRGARGRRRRASRGARTRARRVTEPRRAVTEHLDGLRRVAAGDPDAGELARAPQSEGLHWLVSPASTIVQPGPVHTRLCAAPAALLDRLFARLVL